MGNWGPQRLNSAKAGTYDHSDLRFNSENIWDGISLSTRILLPLGCSNPNEEAWRHSLFTLALPLP